MIIGSDMTPLMTGQVDAVTGWITNTTALKVLGHDYIALRLWDCGVRLYALPYYATTDTLTQKADLIAGFLGRRAAAGLTPRPTPRRRSISWCRNTPISCAPTNSSPRRSCSTSNSLPAPRTMAGAASIPAVWQAQIDQYDELKQFQAGKPKLDQVMTTKILDMTENDRPRIG